ncbi:MAG: hypothetical protein ACC726_06930 [Chloroflexota bacterium]
MAPESLAVPATSDPTEAARASTASESPARFAITRGHLFMLLAVLLPAIASMLAPVFSGDVAYQIRAGQLMFESGRLVTTDPFTFTVFGEPWLNQQWGASIALGLGFELTGWGGLMLMRALLIAATFGLVFAACRGMGASSIVSSLVTLGAFVVAATNLALRSQTFGLLFFAAVVAFLAYRRKYPWLLWLIPVVMIGWANTHGSFFIGWVAIGFAALEDLVARSRVAIATIIVGVLAVLATLLNPWGTAMWEYVVDLSTNPLMSQLVTEWQATTLKSPTGLFFFGSIALVLLLLLVRGRTISWLQLAWLAALAVVGVMAVRGVAWWAIGAAPIVAVLVSGLTIRGRALSDHGLEQRRAIGYTVLAGVLLVFAVFALPYWRPIDALYGPEGILRDAPRGVTETLIAEATPGDRIYSDQKWSSWFELAVPGVPVMVDSRIELFDREIWGDYLHIASARADWQEILDRWQVSLIATTAGEQSQLSPFLDSSAVWTLLYRDEEGNVYRRLASDL